MAAGPLAIASGYTLENRTLTLNRRRAFFREAIPVGESLGSLVLLHGWIGTSSWMFRHVLPELGRRYHTVAPDLPGFGRSQTLAEAPSIDAGEITDKGYINQRAALTRREECVSSLYIPGHPDVIRALPEVENGLQD